MSLLPSSLMDLTILRVSSRLQVHPRSSGRRYMNGAAMAFKPAPDVPEFNLLSANAPESAGEFGANHRLVDRSLYAGKNKPNLSATQKGGRLAQRRVSGWEEMSELERKIEEFKGITGVEEIMETSPSPNEFQPTFSEVELLDVYQDLLDTIPIDSSTASVPQNTESQEDAGILLNLAKRLLPSPEDTQAPALDSEFTPITQFSHPLQSLSKPHHMVISRLTEVYEKSMEMAASPEVLPTPSEWSSLIRTCVSAKEGESAERVLKLMKHFEVSAEELSDEATRVLHLYANSGNVTKVESLMVDFIADTPNPTQRHYHIKAHLTSTPPKTIPLNALTLLHKYENHNLAPPMKTYTSIITTLFCVPSSIAKAQAWDLFSHMRYVAHPDPDAVVYATMIKACASAPASGGIGVSEPERALDLWTEMTVDKRIPPTRDAYNAVILACARSGDKRFVNEAFRLAREMLDGYRDSRGGNGFKPNSDLFAALLEGAKRLGDLARVRWILAEMVKAVVDTRGADEVQLNERIMVHVFHAYASYKVPFKRAQTVVVDKSQDAVDLPKVETQLQNGNKDVTEAEDGDSFASLPPQTQSKVISEARNLFEGMVQDAKPEKTDDEAIPRIFKHVHLNAPLLNSYLSVYYAHARFTIARDLYNSIFETHGVERNIYSFVEALEMCADVTPGTRTMRFEFAQGVWSDWERFQNAHPIGVLPPRLVERTYIAMIRVCALNGELDMAIDHLKAFAKHYPPKVMSKPVSPTKMPIRSTRTVLKTDAPRPIVRFTSATDVTDDAVPPFMSFSDLELLHHRLIAANRVSDLGHVKWLCKAYSGALRHRRDVTLKQGVASNSL